MRRLLFAAAAALVFASTAALPHAGAAPSDADDRTNAAPSGSRAEARLAQAETLAGLTPVTGPGLVVTLRNSAHPAPRGVDPRSLQIRQQDLNEVLNALRAGGAEALAVGGDSGPTERVLVTTGLRENGIGVLVGESRFIAPYRVLAIGDARALRAELYKDGGAVKRAALDALQMIEARDAEKLELPAGRTPAAPRYAHASAPMPVTVAAVPEPAFVRLAPAKPLVAAAAPVPTDVKPAPAKPVVTESKPAPAKSTAATEAKPAAPEVRPIPAKPVAVAEAKPAPAKPAVPESKPAPVKPMVVAEAKPLPAETKPAPAKPAVPESKPAPVKPTAVAEAKPAPAKPAPAPVLEPAAPVRTKPVGVVLPTGSTMVFGGKGLAKYHMPGCRFGERIEVSQRETFASPKDAEKAGRVPCRICCPASN